ncbi:MAG: small multi-drug export protein [Firmicutes bacterium]|jgi:uncharacterized membrane protein|nr:small multi-drug export protein [Bacillota bacterium]
MELLTLVKKEVWVFFMAMMPISELRGAIPLGVSLGLSPLNATIVSILGNSLVVPILLLILEPVFCYFKSICLFKTAIEKIESRAAGKIKNYRKYRLFGLFILVAIPFPTTGVYTGCVAANIMKIKYKNALGAILAGVIMAGIVVFLITTGLL